MLLGTILCKFGQICATEIAFVRLIVCRNSILNFPAKIWTGICRALLYGDDSSYSQGQSGKRLLLASRGHPIRSPAYQGSCIDPPHQFNPLDPTWVVPFLRLSAPIRLLEIDKPPKIYMNWSSPLNRRPLNQAITVVYTRCWDSVVNIDSTSDHTRCQQKPLHLQDAEDQCH